MAPAGRCAAQSTRRRRREGDGLTVEKAAGGRSRYGRTGNTGGHCVHLAVLQNERRLCHPGGS